MPPRDVDRIDIVEYEGLKWRCVKMIAGGREARKPKTSSQGKKTYCPHTNEENGCNQSIKGKTNWNTCSFH